MSDAMYGFATGFAQGFTSTYTARMQNEAAEKRDKIRFGAQAWLKNEERYNAAKASDEQMMQQADALVESQSLIPKDATIDIYNMLRGGMTSSQIISDIRTSGSKFESLPKPSESGLVVEDSAVSTELGDQTDAMLTTENEGLSPAANAPGTSVPNANEVAGENTATAIVTKKEKEDPNNPFTQYQKEIQEAVGQTDNPYFNQVLSGYTPEVRQNKYKFIPGVTKTDIPSLQDMLASSVYNSDEYKTALVDGDEATQQTLVIEAMARSKRSESGDLLKFGTGGVAASMYAWAMTESGKAAIASKDGQAIAAQWRTFDSVINPDKDNTSEFDMADPYTSFFNSWISSPEGQTAVGAQDGNAISEAMAKAEEQAEIVTEALNLAAGFKPDELTDLQMVPGLREKFANYPVVLTQISRISEALTTQERAKNGGGSAKPYTIYSGTMIDGRAQIIGTGFLQDGVLTIGGNKIDPLVASKYILGSPDAPLDFSKVSANDFTERLKGLETAVNFGETAAYYTAGLRNTPTARTRVARFASGVDELLNEFDAARQIASFQGVGKDGNPEVQIDGTRFVESINRGDGALGRLSAEVRAIMAQEAQIVFAYAKADGQTGNALSNKDYDNYFKTIFNSNNPDVVEQNLKRLVGMKYNVALRAADKIGSLPGMDMAIQGTGGSWWVDPRAHVEKDLNPGVVQFLGASTKGVDDLVNTLVPAKTLQESITAYQAGETITVTQEMIDAYPDVFKGKIVGQTFTNTGVN
jgi:hypothetical protein